MVKGIKDYADGSQSSSDVWGMFASVMAASVVANILSDSAIFEDWPHYNPGDVFLICQNILVFVKICSAVHFTC